MADGLPAGPLSVPLPALKWRALSYALLKNIVSGCPLCSKSFN